MAIELPPLPYDTDALEPYLGAATLKLHHGKHHQTYVTNLNNLIKDTPLAGQSLEEIVTATAGNPAQQGIFNNAGQVWNHNLFWHSLKKNGGGPIPGEVESRLKADFGSIEAFQAEFTQAALTQFGSGWAWLVVDDGTLKVTKTPNADSPLAHGQKALAVVDVWEHSYYLDYQNRRADYVKAFLDSLIDWDSVAERLATA